MTKIYIAGKLNADAVGYIKNMYRMIKTAKLVRDNGYAVFVSCNDFLEGLVDGGFDYNDYFDNGSAWLLVSQAIFLTPGWESSEGTKREIELAKENNIPIFSEIDEMNSYFKN